MAYALIRTGGEIWTLQSETWSQLPDDLVNRICNTLPKVRRIPDCLRVQIEMVSDYNDACFMYEVMDDMGLLFDDEDDEVAEIEYTINDLWHQLHCDKRWSIYFRNF